MINADKSFIIWHTGRSGSHHLCDIVHQTQVLGMRSLIDQGLFIGHQGQIGKQWEQRLNDYVAKMTTPNNVFSAKAGLLWLHEFKKDVGWHNVQTFVDSLTHHVVLQRLDLIAQAVSGLFSNHTKRFNSLSTSQRPAPEYNRFEIEQIYNNIIADNARMQSFFRWHHTKPLFIYYEHMIVDPVKTAHQVANHVGVALPEGYTFEAYYRKQSDPLKDAYIQRFKKEHGLPF